jgi:hypothetical protein
MLAVVLVLALAMSASAYDFLYGGDTAMTPEAGSFSVGIGLKYLMADEAYNPDGDSEDIGADWTAMWIPIHAQYGVMDNLAVGVNAKFGMPKLSASDSRDENEIDGSGIGDTWIWAKYMFIPDPVLSARVGVKLPTGEEPWLEFFPVGFYGVNEDGDIVTGSGYTSLDGALMLGVPAGPGTFEAALGYRYNLAREMEGARSSYDYTHGARIQLAAAYKFDISDAMGLSIGMDGFWGSDDEVSSGDSRDSMTLDSTAANAVYFSPAFHYIMDSGMTLGVDMTYPIMGQWIPAEWGLGLYVGWGM